VSSSLSKFLAALEAELKEVWRSGELISMLIILYFLQGVFALIGLSMPKEEDLFLRLSGYGDSVLYQLAGLPVLMVSIVFVGSMTEYLIVMGRRGLVEVIATTPTDRRIQLAAHSMSLSMIMVFYFLSISAPSIALRSGLQHVGNLLPALMVLALGLLPLLFLGFAIANLALRFRAPAVSELMNSLLFTFTGVAYPLVIFPPLVQAISRLLPHPHVAEAVRAAVYYGLVVPAQSWVLLLMTLGYGVLASFLYSSLERGIRRRGLYEAPAQ
jgi:ABC-type polysaccharide/polyol phosphate export permease